MRAALVRSGVQPLSPSALLDFEQLELEQQLQLQLQLQQQLELQFELQLQLQLQQLHFEQLQLELQQFEQLLLLRLGRSTPCGLCREAHDLVLLAGAPFLMLDLALLRTGAGT